MRDDFCFFCPYFQKGRCPVPENERCQCLEAIYQAWALFYESVRDAEAIFEAMERFLSGEGLVWESELFSLIVDREGDKCVLMLTPRGAEVLKEVVEELELGGVGGGKVNILKELCGKRKFEGGGESVEDFLLFARFLEFREDVRKFIELLADAVRNIGINVDLGKSMLRGALIQMGGLIDTFNLLAEGYGFEDRLTFEYEDDSWRIAGTIGGRQVDISGDVSRVYELASFAARMGKRAADMVAGSRRSK